MRSISARAADVAHGGQFFFALFQAGMEFFGALFELRGGEFGLFACFYVFAQLDGAVVLVADFFDEAFAHGLVDFVRLAVAAGFAFLVVCRGEFGSGVLQCQWFGVAVLPVCSKVGADLCL